ncbi:MAG: hypothetical protein HYS22_07240 [Deltaproteobacteria bacterium]|nr:hypothetical protein [Deltaproteobacteria bacterium]
MAFEQYIEKYPSLAFLKGTEFQYMEPARQEYLNGLIEDAIFWIEHEQRRENAKHFFFLGSSLGLLGAEEEGKAKGLTGKALEDHLKPHKQFYTQFNPYSGTTRGPDEEI